jgi:hypothetical protein
MQTLDLLLAMQIRNLAADLRSAARASFYAGIYDGLDEAARKTRLAAWERENPVTRFIPVALEEIEQVADYIAELRTGAMR